MAGELKISRGSFSSSPTQRPLMRSGWWYGPTDGCRLDHKKQEPYLPPIFFLGGGGWYAPEQILILNLESTKKVCL